jgi:hypothetical protein
MLIKQKTRKSTTFYHIKIKIVKIFYHLFTLMIIK